MSSKKKLIPFMLFIMLSGGLVFFAVARNLKENEVPYKALAEEPYVNSPEADRFFESLEQGAREAEVTIEESRKIASDWIRKERSKLSRRFFFRRKLYLLIAEEISESKDYNELNTYLARLPETEKQAYAAMTIDPYYVVTMDEYDPYVKGMAYPMILPLKKNDGVDLLVSSGYTSKRISPVGSGGARPHYAVDIINIGNIDYVSRRGELVRGENHPGYIVASLDGTVENLEYNNVYGWNVTISHDRSLLSPSKRRGIKSFKTFYAHLSEVLYVKEGDKLKKGDKISLVGNSGMSTGPHLHYEVHMIRNDGSSYPVNPYPGSEW